MRNEEVWIQARRAAGEQRSVAFITLVSVSLWLAMLVLVVWVVLR